MDKYDLLYINYLFLMTNLANIVQHIRKRQENTKKMSIFGTYQMNGDVAVVCTHKGSYVILNTHYLGG